jgi:hypothetical protein
VYHLTRAALEFGKMNDTVFVDVLELVGKNIRPGAEIPRSRISFSKFKQL